MVWLERRPTCEQENQRMGECVRVPKKAPRSAEGDASRRATAGSKQALAAWAASHTKNACLASQYGRLAGHGGKKRAVIALGHSILVIFD